MDDKTNEIKKENRNREEDWLWLCSIPQLGWQERTALLHYFGSPEEIRRARRGDFAGWEKLKVKWIRNVYPAMEEGYLQRVRDCLASAQIRFISMDHPDYPKRLRPLTDRPHGLFYKGSLPRDDRLCAAVVGARACSAYGQGMTQNICRELARSGVQVVSGMALGIDGIAQRAAIKEGGMSFAVLGSGADVCYPAGNRDLYEKLPSMGGILSEYACGDLPVRYHFPMRNRIISGLCDVLLLMEARAKSGSLITADYALDQGKDIFVLPGRAGDSLSYGCNRLISQGAQIILSPQELVETMKELWPDRFIKAPLEGEEQKKGVKSPLAPEDELVYSFLDSSPKSLEAITVLTGLAPGEVSAGLLRLQMEDLAAQVAGNQYIRQQ